VSPSWGKNPLLAPSPPPPPNILLVHCSVRRRLSSRFVSPQRNATINGCVMCGHVGKVGPCLSVRHAMVENAPLVLVLVLTVVTCFHVAPLPPSHPSPHAHTHAPPTGGGQEIPLQNKVRTYSPLALSM